MVIIDYKEGELEKYKNIASKIRRHNNLNNIKLICITAKSKRGDLQSLKTIGYNGYLTKPISHNHLYNTLSIIKGFDISQNVTQCDGIITKHLVDEIAPNKYRILLVEDNEFSKKVMAKLLSKFNIRCDIAENGEEAVVAFRDKNYDMILMDCQMPVMDGFQATQKIREIEKKNKAQMQREQALRQQEASLAERAEKVGKFEGFEKGERVDA